MGTWTDQEFATKVDYEGGVFDALFGYGLTSDLLEDQEGELATAVRDLERAWRDAGISVLEDRVQAAIEDAGYDYEEEF